MIRSVLHYISSIWTCCDKEDLGRVLKLQKRAARVISDADNQVSNVKLFNRLHWLPFYEELKIAKCSIAYKPIKGEVPLYTEGSLSSVNFNPPGLMTLNRDRKSALHLISTKYEQ